MDTEPTTGRPLAFAHSFTTLSSSTDAFSAHQYQRHTSGSESETERRRGLVHSRRHVQAYGGGFGGHSASFGGGIAPFSDPVGLNNANATPLYTSDTSFGISSSSAPSHGFTFAPSDFDAHFTGDFYQFSAMPSPIAHPSSQPGSQSQESGGSSPSGSAHSQDFDSDHSGHSAHYTHRSASSNASTQEMSFGGPQSEMARSFASGGVHFSGSERYPAYVNDRRIGLEHVRPDAQVHQNDGTTYYRPRTHTYPPSDEGPHIMNFSSAPHHAHHALQGPRSPEQSPGLMGMMDVPMDFGNATRQHGVAQGGHHMSPIPTPLGTPGMLPGLDIPDSTPHLRQLLGLGPDEEVSLYALSDPDPGQKPNYPYPTLIKLAIHGSAKKKLTLQEIYEALKQRFEWYRLNANDKAWQNSIRHNLSLNRCFRRVERPITEPGKGDYWVVDYSSGEGNKRPRKRNKRPTRAQQRAAQEDHERARATNEPVSSGSDREFTQSPTPGASSASQGSSATSTPFDGNIDPELMDQSTMIGHVVGGSQRRQRSIRDARRGTSPYTSPATVMQHTSLRAPSGTRQYVQTMVQYPQQPYGASTSTTGQFNQFDPSTFGQSSFGQTQAFGQSSFGASSMAPLGSRTGWAATTPAGAPVQSSQYMNHGMTSTPGPGPSTRPRPISSSQLNLRDQSVMSTSSASSSTTSFGRHAGHGGSTGRRSDSSSSVSSME